MIDKVPNFIQTNNIKITGKVTDEEGQELPGVLVKIKNKTKSTQTNSQGNYEIDVEIGDSIIFSYLGMKSQSRIVDKRRVIDVILKSDISSLDEVIVVGYGTTRKSDLTGSISSIKPNQITNAGTIALDQALAGKAAGVQVVQSSGELGAGATIKIRGVSSLSGSQPLYVIDGVLIDNTDMSRLNAEQQASSAITPLSTINPSDIESIEVLKDASATAIYGSRGSNGVVLITTKSGSSDKSKIVFNTELGALVNPNQIKLLDANQFWLVNAEANINAGVPIQPGLLPLLDSAKNGLLKTTNWQDAIFRKGQTQNYDLSFSGGNKDIKYLLSANYLDAVGTLINTNFNRASMRLNIDAKLNNTFSVGTRLYYAIINSNQVNASTNDVRTSGNNSVIRRAFATRPTTSFGADEFTDPEGFQDYSPITAANANKYENVLAQIVGNVFLDVKLSKKFIFKTQLSYQGRNTNQRYYQFNILPVSFSRQGWAKTNDGLTSLLTNTNTLDFRHNVKNHRISATLGQSTEFFSSSAVINSNYGFPNDYLLYYAPQSATFSDPDIYNFASTRLVSFFSRINYTYKNKLLFTFTGRADGSSKFAQNNKFGFFPALALGYRLKEEKLFKDFKDLSNLKLRVSYGLSGNQSIQPYQSLDQLSSSRYGFGNGAGGESLSAIYFANQLPNANLQWEQSEQLNLGFDAGFFNEKLTATFDYYIKNTNNLLVVGNRIPSQSGFTTYTQNLGLMQTKGADLGLNAQIFDNKNFSWNFGTVLSVGKTYIKEMGADFIESGFNQGWVAGGTQRLIIGEQLGAFYGYKRNGIAQFDDFTEFVGLSNEQRVALYNANPTRIFTPILNADGVGVIAKTPGEQLYEDLDGNGIINEFDRKVIGYAQPDLTIGFNNTFRYKSFEININIDAQLGQDVANVANFQLFGFHDAQQLATVTEAWSTTNPSNTYPRLSSSNFGAPPFKFSDRFVEDASFWRLQNITLGYTLPNKLTNKAKISTAKIFISGSNLLVLTNYSGFNPDVSLNGTNNLQMGHDNGGYPVFKSFRAGVNVSY
nr:TonB-dependent receptor [Pedobacter glucosidilyticus]